MALDEPTKEDEVFSIGDLNFVIGEYDRTIIEEYGTVEIDHSNMYGMSRFSVYLSRVKGC